MKLAVVFVMSLSFMLVGCSGNTNAMWAKTKQTGGDIAKTVGLLPKSSIRVPDYYSTRYLPRRYVNGREYDLDRFNCVATEQC